MKQKILEALKAKFQGSNANVLSRIADKLAKTATTEEQVNTAVAGVTQELLEVIESYGDSRATEAQQTAVQNYESKYGLKEGKPTANGGVTSAPKQQSEPAKPQDGGADDVPAWAKALLDANKSLTERLNKMDTERTTTSRKQQLAQITAKLPEKFRKSYDRISVDALTDEQFSSLTQEVTTEVEGLVSDLKAKGAIFGRPSAASGKSNGNELTKEQEAAIAARDGKASSDGQPF